MTTTNEALVSFIQRIEKLEETKTEVNEDIKVVYNEAKSAGFDVKIVKKIVRLRKMEEHKRREEEELVELYKTAVGLE